MIPSLADNHGADPTANALLSTREPAPQKAGSAHSWGVTSGDAPLNDSSLLQRVKEAEHLSATYMQMAHRSAWARSYKAFRNEHFEGSKYLSESFKTRSKIFRPKTRSAVRKNMASAAEALFSTVDAVTITAQDEANPLQVASAAIKSELLNMRLSRSSGKAGIPWFQITMGARQDSQITGLCISKQTWKYEEKTRMERDPLTGHMVAKTIVVTDRPDVLLYAPENVLIDPAADWVNPAQSGAYLILRHPMHVEDVLSMIQPGQRGETAWIQLSEEEVRAFSTSPIDAMATRRARQGGLDNTDRTITGGTFGIVWVYEVFMRIKGQDYTWWTIDARKMLSKPKLVEDVYPAFGGERPVQIGFGSLDSHTAIPMSPVETWQQLQQEANDLANLRLDHMKQVVSPITKVRRGRQVDVNQIQKRGPNTVVLLKDLDDIEFDRPPDVPTSANTEAAYINNDFDDLAGSFSQSSVQGNRQLNETVGGMRLLSGSASAITEFDLRVWVETWVEPVLWQLVKLEEFYENDASLLAVAGERAQLFQRFGISEITDKLLMAQSTVRVNVGTGAAASDPLQKLQKFGMAAKTAAEVLGPFIEMGSVQVQPKAHEILTELFGAAGYKDGGDRFFVNPDDPNNPPQEQKPDPAAMQAQAEMQAQQQQHELEMQAAQQKHSLSIQSMQRKAIQQDEQAKLAADAAQHKAIVRAGQQEIGLENAKAAAEAKRKEEQAKIESVRKVEAAKVAAAEAELEVKRKEAEIRKAELEVKRKGIELMKREQKVKEAELEARAAIAKQQAKTKRKPKGDE